VFLGSAAGPEPDFSVVTVRGQVGAGAVRVWPAGAAEVIVPNLWLSGGVVKPFCMLESEVPGEGVDA
jgi:hypothetical protein